MPLNGLKTALSLAEGETKNTWLHLPGCSSTLGVFCWCGRLLAGGLTATVLTVDAFAVWVSTVPVVSKLNNYGKSLLPAESQV